MGAPELVPANPFTRYASTGRLVLEQIGVVSVNRAEGLTVNPAEIAHPHEARLLLHRADRFVPGLHAAGVDEVRACARPQSLDGRPLVGRVPGHENLFIAAGHGPGGISTGPESAHLVAECILGTAAAIPRQLDPARFL